MTRAAWSRPKSDAGAQGAADRQLTPWGIVASELPVNLPRRGERLALCRRHPGTLRTMSSCMLPKFLCRRSQGDPEPAHQALNQMTEVRRFWGFGWLGGLCATIEVGVGAAVVTIFKPSVPV